MGDWYSISIYLDLSSYCHKIVLGGFKKSALEARKLNDIRLNMISPGDLDPIGVVEKCYWADMGLLYHCIK